jgi:hypothetical protein
MKFPFPQNIMKAAEKPIEEDEEDEEECDAETIPEVKEGKEVPRSVTEVKEQKEVPVYTINPMIMFEKPCPEKIIEKKEVKETHFRDPRLVLLLTNPVSVERKQKRKRSKQEKVQRMRVKLQKTDL